MNVASLERDRQQPATNETERRGNHDLPEVAEIDQRVTRRNQVEAPGTLGCCLQKRGDLGDIQLVVHAAGTRTVDHCRRQVDAGQLPGEGP